MFISVIGLVKIYKMVSEMQVIGLFTGVLTRLYIPYFMKLYKNPGMKFDKKYLKSGFAGLLIAFVFTLILMPAINIYNDFILSFSMGFMFHSLSREMEKILK